MRITIHHILISFFSIVLLWNSSSADDWNIDIMSADAIRPGMRGVGKTVFYGTEVEEFGVEVLDIIKNYYPQRDIILVRLYGEKVEQTGVVSGMSGSPVYIDGKLVGALALRVGNFMKEPIGGVMPIEAMLEVAGKEALREIEQPSLPYDSANFLNAALGAADPDFWRAAIASSNPQKIAGLRIIRPPLLLSGFDSRVERAFTNDFESLGFIAMSSGTSSSANEQNAEPPFEPGSAISQVLIDGDMSISMSGTVTCVKGNQLLAFGHYLFNVGPVNLPLARARVLATLPSLMASERMTVSGEIVGSIRQDRLAGVYGVLGEEVPMVPVCVRCRSKVDGEREFNFRMAVDRSLNVLTPFFLRIALINAIVSARLSGGESSLSMTGAINLKDGGQVPLNNFFSAKPKFGMFATFTDAAAAADEVAALLGVLLVNKFKAAEIEQINLNLEVVPGQNLVSINSVWCDKSQIEPGQSLELIISLQRAKGTETSLRRQIHIPKTLSTTQLRILVSSASELTKNEIQTMRQKYIPTSFDQIIKILGRRRKNNNLYIQVRARDHGVIIGGEEFETLPPSILTIMNSRRFSGETSKLRERIIFEEAIPIDCEVIGAKSISVRVDKRKAIDRTSQK